MKKSCPNKDIFPLRTGVREGIYSLTQIDTSTGQPMAGVNISGRQARLRRNNTCLRCGPICNTGSCPKCVQPGECGQQVFTKPVTFPRIPRIDSDIGRIRFERNVSTNSITVYSWRQ